MMQLLSLANMVPKEQFTQQRVWREIENTAACEGLRDSSRGLLRKVLLGNSGIVQRQLAASGLEELISREAEDLNRVFEREAANLASAALNKALDHAGIKARELDALLVCTCTGYLCPGLSSFVAERCGLRGDVHLLDLVGLGCGAALPLLRQAGATLLQGAGKVACIAVEICSAAFYLDDDPGVLISFCLFGDGASASIWTNDKRNPAIGSLESVRSLHWPEERESLRFVNARGKLKNVLASSVPGVGARAVAELARECEQPLGTLLVHPGGKKVLEAISGYFPDQPLSESWEVLRAHGNMSSPSILFVLDRWLKGNSSVERATLTSFGAGFTCHMAGFRRH
jgi:predicted naringenin-chalcone synthase